MKNTTRLVLAAAALAMPVTSFAADATAPVAKTEKHEMKHAVKHKMHNAKKADAAAKAGKK